MLGLEDEDSMDKMEISPPPLSPQAPPVLVTTPPASPPHTPQHQAPVPGKLGKSPLSPDIEKLKKLDKTSNKLQKSSKKSLDLDSPSKHLNGDLKEPQPIISSDNEEEDDSKHSKSKQKLSPSPVSEDKLSSKKRRKGEKKAKSKELVATTDSESETEQGSPPAKLPTPESSQQPKTALENIPSDMRFEPKNLLVKPKGLVDALSNFFTPGLKRTSRTAMNSLIKPEHSIIKNDAKSTEQSKEEVKKVRLSVEEKEESSKKDDSIKPEERKRHASSGQQQVKSLYDGLSHLYNDCDSRLRSAPKDQKDQKEQSEKRDKSSDEKTPDADKDNEEKKEECPSRTSDTERPEKDDEKKNECKTEEEDKAKGTSKNHYLLGMNFCNFIIACFTFTNIN